MEEFSETKDDSKNGSDRKDLAQLLYKFTGRFFIAVWLVGSIVSCLLAKPMYFSAFGSTGVVGGVLLAAFADFHQENGFVREPTYWEQVKSLANSIEFWGVVFSVIATLQWGFGGFLALGGG